QRLHVFERGAHVRRKDHAYFDQTVLLQDRRSRIAGYRRRDRGGDVIRGDAELRSAQGIDFERHGWATDNHAVPRINHAIDLLDRTLDFICLCLQCGSIFTEKLNLDRLRIALQVADHVRHDADKLDFQSRLSLSDFVAQFRNHFFRTAFVPGFQFYGIVATVGFSYEQPHFETGTPRVAYDLRSLQ